MSRKCPRCGSKDTKNINAGKQILEGVGKIVGYGASILLGHPNAGKALFASPLDTNDKYKCNTCGKEWEED